MERIYIVAVGGDGDQAVEGKYVGTDGAKAQAVFDEEGQDGSNSIVRFFHFPPHSQIRTPKRDGVPPREKTAGGAGKKAKDKTPTAATTADTDKTPAASQEETDGNDSEDHGI